MIISRWSSSACFFSLRFRISSTSTGSIDSNSFAGEHPMSGRVRERLLGEWCWPAADNADRGGERRQGGLVGTSTGLPIQREVVCPCRGELKPMFVQGEKAHDKVVPVAD